MDTTKIKTLQQVSAALVIVESAMTKKNLSDDESNSLQTAFVGLRNIERTIINMVTDELIGSLKTDSAALEALTDKITQSSKKLAAVAVAIGKATQVVDAFISIVVTAVGAGLV